MASLPFPAEMWPFRCSRSRFPRAGRTRGTHWRAPWSRVRPGPADDPASPARPGGGDGGEDQGDDGPGKPAKRGGRRMPVECACQPEPRRLHLFNPTTGERIAQAA